MSHVCEGGEDDDDGIDCRDPVLNASDFEDLQPGAMTQLTLSQSNRLHVRALARFFAGARVYVFRGAKIVFFLFFSHHQSRKGQPYCLVLICYMFDYDLIVDRTISIKHDMYLWSDLL